MGLLALHSAHYSKILKRLLGTSLQPALAQRRRARAGVDASTRRTRSRQGVPHPIVIDAQEMYGEHFDIPEPDDHDSGAPVRRPDVGLGDAGGDLDEDQSVVGDVDDGQGR